MDGVAQLEAALATAAAETAEELANGVLMDRRKLQDLEARRRANEEALAALEAAGAAGRLPPKTLFLQGDFFRRLPSGAARDEVLLDQREVAALIEQTEGDVERQMRQLRATRLGSVRPAIVDMVLKSG